MYLVMFDIDGTLINSSSFEDKCYLKAIRNVITEPIETNWGNYKNATDSGILYEIIENLGYLNEKDEIFLKVKKSFIAQIKSYISNFQVEEISGASDFIDELRNRNDVALAIATGGWPETAKLKLDSAGIDCTGISFASSADHHIRTEIMKCAEKKCNISTFSSKTYFGDAVWDKQASIELGYNFILVGNSTNHKYQINNYKKSNQAMSIIGL